MKIKKMNSLLQANLKMTVFVKTVILLPAKCLWPLAEKNPKPTFTWIFPAGPSSPTGLEYRHFMTKVSVSHSNLTIKNDQFDAFEATVNCSETHLHSCPALLPWLPQGARPGRWEDNLHINELCIFVTFFKLY